VCVRSVAISPHTPDTRGAMDMPWGYAVCDAAIRKHVEPGSPPTRFPCPSAGV